MFQLSCADVRERFHLIMLLLAVTLQTMKEYAWHSDRLAVLLPDCVMLLFAEVLVDWVGIRDYANQVRTYEQLPFTDPCVVYL